MGGFTLIRKLFVQVTSWVNMPPHHSTNYRYTLFRKSGQVSSLFERGSKTPYAVSINSILEVLWLHIKSKIKKQITLFNRKRVHAKQAFHVTWINPPVVLSLFQFFVVVVVNHYAQPLRHQNTFYLYSVKIR